MGEITDLSRGAAAITAVLADNLAYFMKERGLKQTALAKRSGVGQTTIGLYLNPKNRKESKTGKNPGPLLPLIQQLATALEVELWELLRPLTPAQRTVYHAIEAAFLMALEQAKNDQPPQGKRRVG